MFWIGGDRGQRLGRGFEQDVVDDGLVLIGDVADRRRQGEHHVIVRHRQQLGLALGEPLLGGGALALRTVAASVAVCGGLSGRARRAARGPRPPTRRAGGPAPPPPPPTAPRCTASRCRAAPPL